MGTSKGLIVLDTRKNMLVQVVGSDNKLFSEYTWMWHVIVENEWCTIWPPKLVCETTQTLFI